MLFLRIPKYKIFLEIVLTECINKPEAIDNNKSIYRSTALISIDVTFITEIFSH